VGIEFPQIHTPQIHIAQITMLTRCATAVEFSYLSHFEQEIHRVLFVFWVLHDELPS